MIDYKMNNKHVFIYILIAILFACFGISSLASAAHSPIDLTLAHQYFQEADALCNQDNGQLWGVSLCAPLIFVDAKTRVVVANQTDKENHLIKEGDVFIGKLPETVTVANTATDWAGVKWTMVLWPLPQDKVDRTRLLAHEMWHRVQAEIGLPMSGPSNNHLDSLEGRYLVAVGMASVESGADASGLTASNRY